VAIELTKLNRHLPKILRMSRILEKPDITHAPVAAMRAAEAVLLDYGDGLHDEANGEEYHVSDVVAGAEGGLGELGDWGGVEDCDGERDDLDPGHLAGGGC
jgi:hypothetical protein